MTWIRRLCNVKNKQTNKQTNKNAAAGETRDWLFAYLCTLFLRIVLGATVVAVNSALVNRSSRERSDAAPRDAYHLSLPAPASFH